MHTADWVGHAKTLRQMKWYICRYGNQDEEKVTKWGLRKMEREMDGISHWIKAEYPDV